MAQDFKPVLQSNNPLANSIQKNNYNKEVEFFPRDRIFPKFYADGVTEQFSLNKDLFTKRFIGAIGGSHSIVQFYWGKYLIQIGLGATVYASLIKKPDVVEVQTAGFFVDLPIDIQLTRNIALRTGYGHYSAHLVDDGLDALQIQAINYAKDYVPLFISYNIDKSRYIFYGGFRFDTYTIPEYHKRWNFQIGAEGGNYLITEGVKLYGAVDIKFKSEAGWGSTQSYQIGLKFLESHSNALRLAYTYRTGLEDRGQFYKKHVSLSLVGFYFDF